jgi:PAB1-binding protein PBP1
MEEERGKVVEGDYDEEDLYSGVLGKTEQVLTLLHIVIKRKMN